MIVHGEGEHIYESENYKNFMIKIFVKPLTLLR